VETIEVFAALVNRPVPESVMSPAALIDAPGATVDPPLMVIVPAELNVPVPVYAVLGLIVMFLEFVVV
jgi:hypothetical protein